MRRRTAVVIAAIGALVVAPLGSWVAKAAVGAGPACSVDYSVAGQWAGGFQGTVTVRNSSAAVTSWTVGFDYPDAGQKITQSWNAIVTQSGTHVTFKNAAWNGSLASGATATFGFIGSFSGANPAPTAFTVNGNACTPAGTTPAATTPAATSASSTPAATSGSPSTTRPTTTTSTTATTTTSRTTTTTPVTTTPAAATTTASSGAAPVLSVSGNRITAGGSPYRFLGVNRSGGEFACIQGYGIWDGPMDAASVDAMRSWKVRVVRVPLNEECWLGTGSAPAQYSGATYQAAVKSYVDLLISKGITPVVELHWTYGQYTGASAGCSDVKATCQKPMPDATYSPSFWSSVATAFKGRDQVAFDLFNEPYPERATGDATSGWTCWRDGGTCKGIGYRVAGMQSLLDAVRGTGATNVVLAGGLAYSNDLSQWLTYAPKDPLGKLAASAHVYNFNSCANSSCWDSQIAPVAAKVPVVLTELGENDCAHGFADTLMSWADSHSVGYLGWTWNTWTCSSGPALITDYAGTPTGFGAGLKARLATVSS